MTSLQNLQYISPSGDSANNKIVNDAGEYPIYQQSFIPAGTFNGTIQAFKVSQMGRWKNNSGGNRTFTFRVYVNENGAADNKIAEVVLTKSVNANEKLFTLDANVSINNAAPSALVDLNINMDGTWSMTPGASSTLTGWNPATEQLQVKITVQMSAANANLWIGTDGSLTTGCFS